MENICLGVGCIPTLNVKPGHSHDVPPRALQCQQSFRELQTRLPNHSSQEKIGLEDAKTPTKSIQTQRASHRAEAARIGFKWMH